jgi:hypothetical protein
VILCLCSGVDLIVAARWKSSGKVMAEVAYISLHMSKHIPVCQQLLQMHVVLICWPPSDGCTYSVPDKYTRVLIRMLLCSELMLLRSQLLMCGHRMRDLVRLA